MASAGGKHEVYLTNVKIPCLTSFAELHRLCESNNLKLSEETSGFFLYKVLQKIGPFHAQKLVNKLVEKGQLRWDEDFEVESILGRRVNEQNKELYLVKWKDWDPPYNSWEPRENLANCEDMIKEFLRHSKKPAVAVGGGSMGVKRKSPCLPKGSCVASKKERIDELFCRLRRANIPLATAAAAAATGEDAVPEATSGTRDVPNAVPLLKGLVTSEQFKGLLLKAHSGDRRRHPGRGVRIRQKRLLVQEALKKWECEINAISKDPVPIVVVNDFDLEGPPDNFKFINDYIPGEGVTMPNDPIIGCECSDCYESRKSCCAQSCGSVFAYSSAGRVRLPPGTPIYECNKRCRCPSTCPNRVVQNGRKVKVAIFRTHNGCGWGVKALQKIKKGTFIMEYIGEVITNEEAERRGRIYDAEGRTYLFDLDYNDGDCPFTVDAGFNGNISHFVNHSCDPNMSVYGVWIDTLDPRLPRICMFAKRDIARDEELTFDYMMTGDTTVQKRDESTPVMSPNCTSPSSPSGRKPLSSPSLSLGAQRDMSGTSRRAAAGFNVNATGDGARDGASDVKDATAVGTQPNASGGCVTAAASRFSCLQYRIVCQCRAANCRKYLF